MKKLSLILACAGIISVATFAHATLPQDGKKTGTVQAGVKDTTQLSQTAVDLRTKEGFKKGSAPNSLIAQGGRKIEALSTQLLSLVSKGEYPIASP